MLVHGQQCASHYPSAVLSCAAYEDCPSSVLCNVLEPEVILPTGDGQGEGLFCSADNASSH